MNILNEAILLYKKKEYAQALGLFERAGERYGKHVVSANIRLCQQALGLPGKPNNQTATTESATSSLSMIAERFNTYFDRIYLVNLKSEQKKRLTSSLHLKKYGIRYELFEATNGYVGNPLEKWKEYTSRPVGSLCRYREFSELEVKRGRKFIESAGAIGYIFTYLKILEDAKAKKYRRILILEDDVLLHREFFEKFHNFTDRISKSWKILQLGASQYNWQSVDDEQALSDGYYFPRRLDTCGSFAIALDSSVYDELIEAESAFDGPFDHLPLGEIYERHLEECFVSYPNIVMPDVSTSSIRGGRCQEKHGEKMRWRISDFEYPLERPAIAIFVNSAKNLKYLSRFSEGKSQPFDLRIYFNSVDGVRPLHNPELLDAIHNVVTPFHDAPALPHCDFAAIITSDEVLTEIDICHYLEIKLLGKNHATALKDLSYNSIPEVEGRVSIIVPTYKRPKNLENALRSVLEQDYIDKEIIVVSDNPEQSVHAGESRVIVDSLRVIHPDIAVKYIQHKHNRNGSAARNTGLLHSTGEFVCFLDDDDIYLPGRIRSGVEALRQASTNVAAVYCGFLGWNSPVNDLNRYKSGNLARELLLLDYKKHYLHTNTVTYRRKALFSINGFDESYRRHQDLEMNLRFFERFEVGVVKEPGVRLNPEPSAVSNKLFNAEILELKEKFLFQFRDVINRFDKDTQKAIYDLHWKEVARYTSDQGILLKELAGKNANGAVQILLHIMSDRVSDTSFAA